VNESVSGGVEQLRIIELN